MACLDSSVITWMLAMVQMAGLASAWLARLSEGRSAQALFQCLFLACLGTIGLAAMLLVPASGMWLALAATFSTMVLAAVWDFRPHARVAGL